MARHVSPGCRRRRGVGRRVRVASARCDGNGAGGEGAGVDLVPGRGLARWPRPRTWFGQSPLPMLCWVVLSQLSQPIPQPCENQRQGWPDMLARAPNSPQAVVLHPGAAPQPSRQHPQLQLYAWISPKFGMCRSTALRLAGSTMAPCAVASRKSTHAVMTQADRADSGRARGRRRRGRARWDSTLRNPVAVTHTFHARDAAS